MATYINLPVTPDVKQIIDEYRREHGLKSYSETLRKIFKKTRKGNIFLMDDMRGILKGTPDFVRDKRDRHFD
ncbi:hypothetical protein HY572_05765 [Candidatus Micrarchaeota archaeon]|nr:hypothetical protein [Candidatus Micrarchaeota archaeon]